MAELPKPRGVFDITVDCDSVTDTFGCRIAADLPGTFDERTEGTAIAGIHLLRPAAPRPPGQLKSDGRGRGVESDAVFETYQSESEVLGATGQQVVVGHRTGGFVEVDLGYHCGGDILRKLVDVVGVSKLEIW